MKVAERQYRWRRANPERWKAIQKASWERNRDKRLAEKKAYRLEHIEEFKERDRTYHQTHRQERLDYLKTWRETNKEQAKAGIRKWREAHPESVRRWAIANYERHREQYLEANRRYWANHPEQVHIWHANQTARRKILTSQGTITLEEWRAIKAVYKQCCAYCDSHPSKLTQDHVVPLSRGGKHEMQNIVPACMDCNRRKHAKLPTIAVKVLML